MPAFAQASLLSVFGLDLAIQLFGWAAAAVLQTERFYDLTGSLTYITLSLLTLLRGGASAVPRAQIATALVCLWAGRLGTYLVARISKDGHDKRFDGVRDNPPRFLAFWIVQAVWVFVTGLPCWLVNLSPGQKRALGLSDFLGAPTSLSSARSPCSAASQSAVAPHAPAEIKAAQI
jgi:steroid 5-alpha reductase family enzyme